MERIGVLTSGGDAPGMNAAVRSVTRSALEKGLEVLGIRRGFAGLVNGEIFPLRDDDVSGKVNRGGTFLLTARSEKFRSEEGQQEALENLQQHGIDALVIIGGDGSMRGARALENKDFDTMGIPGSIDNDLACTDYSIGFDTATNTIVEAVDKLRDTATSHERVFVVETMGRDNGLLTLDAGLAAGAEAILIPEIDFELETVCRRVAEGYRQGKLHNLIMVAEGIELEGIGSKRERAVFKVGRVIERHTGHEVREVVLGHVQRGGAPSAKDRIWASRMGKEAVSALLTGHSGQMVSKQGHNLTLTPYEDVVAGSLKIDRELYELAHIIG